MPYKRDIRLLGVRTIKRTYRYRLLGGGETFERASQWLGLCRRLYNAGLEQRIVAYKHNGVPLSCYDQMKELPELKVAFPEYSDVGSQVLQEVLERLDRAYKGFFRRVKNGDKAGFPRFKGRGRYDSFTLKQCGWKLDGKYLTIRNIGTFKLRLSRPIEGVIKTITICRDTTEKWYACFSCDKVPEKRLPESDSAVGIDVGIKSFCVDSDGGKESNPEYLKKSLGLLRRRQRKLCRRAKGSNRRQKARLLVAKAHEKIRNQRRDFLHKLANHYVKDYGVICVEDLNIKGMARNRHLSRSINDAGWGLFIGLVEYKAEEAGRKLIRIPRFEPTSKTCSECGAVNEDLTLSDRQWVCKACGAVHDRDFNAAKNILRVGQTLQEKTYAVAQSVS